MTRFDQLLRRGLMDANLAQYEKVLQKADSWEPDFSSAYLRERMRLLANPWGWMRRQNNRRINWRLIVLIAALLLLSACAYAAATGQFSRWFPMLGANPKAPELSEDVLTRMGTVIEQSQTVDGATVTLYAAVWDGNDVWLSMTVESPGIPKELCKDSHIYYEECSLELPEDQRRSYLRKELVERMGDTPEDLEERLQAYREKEPSPCHPGFSLFSQEEDALTLHGKMRLMPYVEQLELTLHIENIAIYEDSGEPVTWLDGIRTGPGPEVPILKGPFDFTFKLEEPVLPVTYTGDVETACGGVPLRFTEFKISALNINVGFEVLAPANLIPGTEPGEPEPGPGKLGNDDLKRAIRRAVRGLWTKEGGYVDCSESTSSMSLAISQNGTGAGGNTVRSYPYPVDTAAVTAVDVAGTRVELRELERRTR